MKVNFPKLKNHLKAFLNILPVIVLAVVIYIAFGKIWISIASFVLLLVLMMKIQRYKFNRDYQGFLKTFGTEVESKQAKETYDRSIMGCVPFQGKSAVCLAYVDYEGIVVDGKRYLPWELIVGYKLQEYIGQPIIELNVGSFEQHNRLSIPWTSRFASSIPEILGGDQWKKESEKRSGHY